jgi:hypothetical protein
MVFSAGCDNEAQAWKLGQSSGTVFGKHDAPIKTIHYNQNAQVIVTGSWVK